MAAKLKVENLERLLRKLTDREKDGKRQAVTVKCGYATPYALDVHEDLVTPRLDGQPKFLEQPARQYERQIGEVARETMRRTDDLAGSLRAAGEFLGTVSRPLVPVETGRLRDSFFVSVEPNRA